MFRAARSRSLAKYVASSEDTTIAIVEAINGRVVLVMTSYRGELQHVRSVKPRIFLQSGKWDELRFTGFSYAILARSVPAAGRTRPDDKSGRCNP